MSKKEKERTPEHGQWCGDCWESGGREIEWINGDEKNKIYFKNYDTDSYSLATNSQVLQSS